ncbi:unnamed protein product, partial [Meganyctiphanes norvegica]
VADVYDGIYSGLRRPDSTEDNQCGIVVEQASNVNNGRWTCIIYNTQYGAFVGSKNLVITVAPTPTKMSPKQIIAYPGDQQEIECSVTAARPAVKITWTSNGRDITAHAKAVERHNIHDDTFMTLSTLHRVFHQDYNGKLECVIAHPTLDEPDVTFIPVTVYFSPVEKPDHTFFQIKLNSDYEVILSFSANPQPTALMWSFESNSQEMANHIQIPFNNGKFSTSLIIGDNGNYQVLLRVAEITNEDIETHFNLHVANEIGAADYSVMLSEAQDPI